MGAMVFFANNLIEVFNEYAGSEIPTILDEHTANVILGITGLISALLDLVNSVRENHGIDDGCDLSELGNPFRWIARNQPDAFPPESLLELYCTECDATFEDLFYSDYHSLLEKGYGRYDDGNVCTLVCTMPSVEGRPRVSSYPIWCKDNGFSGGRWTLSTQKAEIAHRLCPKALPTASNPVTNFSMASLKAPYPGPS